MLWKVTWRKSLITGLAKEILQSHNGNSIKLCYSNSRHKLLA